MKKTIRITILLTVLLLLLTSSASSFEGYTPLTREEFDRWPWLPEYTVFNFFPSKGNNCTWYAHGRMMQLGYCKYTLDSMRFNANTWADDASRGATVSETAAPGTIAFWESGVYYGSRLGHVGVVEAVREDGAILVSDSSSSSSVYSVKQINPGSTIWPTAFISVPLSREKSGLFTHGEHVRTTVNNLNFRLEGINQPSVVLPRETVVEIREHVSNGIYASQPGSMLSYHYWWYAAAELEEGIKYGWLAETYLETTGLIDPSLPPLPEASAENEPPVVSDQEQMPDIKYGDVIGNGLVDVRDVTLVMQHVLKVRELDLGQLVAADVNRDGVIDVLDITLIMRYILGSITSL